MLCLTNTTQLKVMMIFSYVFLNKSVIFVPLYILICNPYGIDFCVKCEVSVKIYLFFSLEKGICLDFDWYCVKSVDEFKEN